MTKFIKTGYDGCGYITAGKWYEVTRDDGDYVEVISDIGYEVYTEIKNSDHLHGHDFEIQEAKTLQELDLKEGDVVECVSNNDKDCIGDLCVVNKDGNAITPRGGLFTREYDLSYGRTYILISRADTADTPKLWRDMADEEKGALLLADYNGEIINCWDGEKWWRYVGGPFVDELAYRIKPTPKVETEYVSIVNADNITIGCGTITTHNGKPEWKTLKGERL